MEDPAPGHEQYVGKLAIPYLRPSSKNDCDVVSIRFRCVEDHDHRGHGKYLTTAGDRPRLYNTLALLQPSSAVAICEGELDAITAQICGIPSVGVPGATSWLDHFAEPFMGYKQVFVLADGDEAGSKFATTIKEKLYNARVIQMPDGEDVNSLVVKQGKSALLERIK